MNLGSVRIAARNLRKQPGFAGAVIVSLALGIALNTTMYGVLDALIKPRIDMREPGRLYRVVYYGDMHWHVNNFARSAALTSGMHSYESITRQELSPGNQLIENGETIHEAGVMAVGPNYFDVLGARPLAGRTFLASDETEQLPPVVITDALATQLFPNGDSPIGVHIRVRNQPRIIIGVISHAANFPNDHFGAWEIAPMQAMGPFIRIIRLRAGATPRDADRELSVISNRIAAEAGDNPREDGFRFHQTADPEFQFREVHYALIGAVIAVLLVACANVANIQLARGIGRRRELALRSALGASRRRLIVHLLHETAILAVIGLALGLVLTGWGSSVLAASIPPAVGSYIVEPQFSWRVLVFALVATMVSLVMVGVLPAIGISRTDPNELLKAGAGTGATKSNRRRYGVLVGVEIALALALSSLAAVTVRTTMLMSQVGEGYDTRPLSTGFLAPRAAHGTVVRYGSVLRTVTSRLETVPGVASAAATLNMLVDNGTISVDDAGGVREVMAPMYGVTVSAPSYVRTMGYPIIKGRDFIDGEQDHGAVLIDERSARALWPNADPVGALIKFGDAKSNRAFVHVVGVFDDDKRFATAPDPAPVPGLTHRLGKILYLPDPADSVVATLNSVIPVRYVARAGDHPARLPIALRRAADDWADFRSFGVQTMDDALGITRARQSSRFMASLFALFAAMGVGLAAFGVYGVVAHAVAERRRELGVRVALGATRRDILHAVLRETVVVALAGAAGGLLITRFGATLLWQIAPPEEIYDAPMFALVALIVVATAAVSATPPALRATNIDPTESLRAE